MVSRVGTTHIPAAARAAFLILVLAALLLTPYFLHPERRNTMPTIETSDGLLTGIPPIDKAAPKKTETATFSLG
jgi:hypothetical protein